MTDRVVLAVAANAAYFAYLRDMLLSFRACGGESRCDVVVFDVGLDASHIDWLQHNVTRIIRPAWPLAGLENQPEWFKTMACRPFFPSYLADWDIIISIDADSWFQNLRAIDLALAGVRHSGFVVVPHIDRCYWQPSASANSLNYLEWHKNSLAEGFGTELSERWYRHPIIAAGFFAGHRHAPHWQVWQTLLATALQRKTYFSVEQAALSLAVHGHGLATQLLPSYCHWMGHSGAIGLDTSSGELHEPQVPFEPISIMALAADSKTHPVICATRDGRTLARSIRYGATKQALSLQVNGSFGALSTDGMASVRFREALYMHLSRNETINFLQIGAMDGVSFDPVFPFVTRYGWQGVLVEPLPDMMARLKTNYTGRPGIRFAEAAISDARGTAKMSRVAPTAATSQSPLPDWSQGISSLKPSRNALGGHNTPAEIHAQLKQATIEVEVATLSFADLVAEYHLARLHVIQIDAEGSDWDVLQQINLDVHQPWVVQIEIQCLPAEETRLAINKLHQAGYRCYLMEDCADLLSVRADIDAALCR